MISNPKRVAIIKALENEPLFVGEIYKKTGMKQAICSQMLIQLKQAGILKSEKTGTKILYQLADQMIINLIVIGETIAYNNAKRN
jgi:DNA-binding transcriptional ArsR family regulator